MACGKNLSGQPSDLSGLKTLSQGGLINRGHPQKYVLSIPTGKKETQVQTRVRWICYPDIFWSQSEKKIAGSHQIEDHGQRITHSLVEKDSCCCTHD